MKFTLVLVIVAAILGGVLSCSEADFAAFKAKYNKVYADEAEDKKHMETYCQNMKSIEEHKKLFEEGKTTFEQGENQFTDLSPEEFRASSLGGLRKVVRSVSV